MFQWHGHQLFEKRDCPVFFQVHNRRGEEEYQHDKGHLMRRLIRADH